jgi:hypothetical protein
MHKLKERIEIEASLQAVWEVLEDFGGVAHWAPYMRKSSLLGEKKTGVGTCRSMRHAWGFRFEETVTEWSDCRGFSFNVDRAPWPMKNVKENWEIEHGNGRTTVATGVNYGMGLGFLGALLDRFFVLYVVRREMRAGLRGLKQHVESEAANNKTYQPI